MNHYPTLTPACSPFTHRQVPLTAAPNVGPRGVWGGWGGQNCGGNSLGWFSVWGAERPGCCSYPSTTAGYRVNPCCLGSFSLFSPKKEAISLTDVMISLHVKQRLAPGIRQETQRWQNGGNAPSACFLSLREAGQASVRGPSSEPGCLGQGMQRPCIFQGSPRAASGWRCSSQAGPSCSSNLLMLRIKRKDSGWEEGEGQSGGRR